MTNMNYEAFLGFGAFNTKKITGQSTVDFLEWRRQIADGAMADADTYAKVMGKPQE
jgi:6-oxo-cyclohex-1-ene-carbonyl-CoA hydrolase